jgi:hypothetical protein
MFEKISDQSILRTYWSIDVKPWIGEFKSKKRKFFYLAIEQMIFQCIREFYARVQIIIWKIKGGDF